MTLVKEKLGDRHTIRQIKELMRLSNLTLEDIACDPERNGIPKTPETFSETS